VNEFANNQRGREATLAAVRYAGLSLPARPRLAPWLVAVELGDTRLQLRSAESAHTLTHPLLIDVFRKIETRLDGRHTVAEIASTVGPDVLPTTVVFLLKLLQGKGLLQPGFDETELDPDEQERWQRQLAFLAHFVPDAASAHSLLAKAHVGLAGPGDLRRAIADAIGSIGVGCVTGFDEPPSRPTQDCSQLSGLDLIVACEQSAAFAFFDRVNRVCLASGTRWLRVCLLGTSAEIGPTVVPNQTACYTCFDLRRRANQLDLDGYLAYRARIDALGGRVDEGGVAPFLSLITGQVALEVMRLLIGFAPPVTLGRFYELTAASPVAVAHDVFRVPRCASCGRRTVGEAWDQSFALGDVES
jgi:bacteriocin biosynthesis cyclodehydratase domain-containing protein